jgi:glycosyltransferase involved in cell wall biosynthesis
MQFIHDPRCDELTSLSPPESATQIRMAIVVVTRNCLAALDATVQSVRALSDPRVWPILIDGASTDGTAERVMQLRGWAQHAVSEPDRGIYDAMNKGWLAAPIDSYVLFLGAGDCVLELPRTSDLSDPAGRPVPLVLGDCVVGEVPFRSRWGMEMRLRNTAHHQAMLVHKSLSPDPPFDALLRVYGDWDFNLRLLKSGVSARHVCGFRTRAEIGGISWHHELMEIRQVASRHSGRWVGAAAYALNGISRWRRDRAGRHAAQE